MVSQAGSKVEPVFVQVIPLEPCCEMRLGVVKWAVHPVPYHTASGRACSAQRRAAHLTEGPENPLPLLLLFTSMFSKWE